MIPALAASVPVKSPARLAFLAVSAVMLLALSCGGSSEPSGKAVLTISGTAEDMGSVSSLVLTVDSVHVHDPRGYWVNIATQSQAFDLIKLRDGGSPYLLAQADLKAASYNGIMLFVSRATVTDQSGEHDAYLPGNRLEIGGVLDVKANAIATASVDFLADQSLHLLGADRYVLAPVVRLETRSNASVKVDPDNKVRISGGAVKTNVQVGMDLEGNVDVGLRISPDAVLGFSSYGRVIQTSGHVLVTGTLGNVDRENGTFTITTRSGTVLVLHVAGDSSLKANSGDVPLSYLADRLGSEIAAQYDAVTMAVTKLFVDADAAAKADIGANIDIRGVVKSIDMQTGIMTVTTTSGTDVSLKVAPVTGSNTGPVTASPVTVSDAASTLGSKVNATLNPATGAASALKADTQATVSSSGTIKSVNPAEGSLTIVTKDGTEIVLLIASDSRITVGGYLASLVDLKGLIGTEVALIYNQQSRFVSQVNAIVQLKELATVSGTLTLVDVFHGFLTITTDSGEDVVLKAPSDSSASTGGIAAALAFLTSSIGARATATYDADTGVIVGIAIGG